MKKVLVTPRSFGIEDQRPIQYLEQHGYEVLKNPHGRILTVEEMKELIKDVDAVIIGVDPLNEEVLKHANKLKHIAKYGVGLDNVDVDYAALKGIDVSITLGANARSVAEYAVGLMLAVSRKIVSIDAQCRQKDWTKNQTINLYNKTVGLIGLGHIGKEVVKLLKGFDCRILAVDQVQDEKFSKEYHVEYTTIEQLIKDADVISVHVPLFASTHHMISTEQFKQMKSNAIIINTSRGGIIDEDALIHAIKDKQIYGAGLDVFEHEPLDNEELISLSQVVLGTHCSASSKDAIEQMGMQSVKNIVKGEKNG